MARFDPGTVLVAIPVKALADSKSRLSSALKPRERTHLTLAMLEDVVRVALASGAASGVAVISADRGILGFAGELGADAVREGGRGLNRAVEQVTAWCIRRGAGAVLILPSDIPCVTVEDIRRLVDLGSERRSVALSPSDDGGTNALLRNPPDVIPPRFGANSFMEHLSAARMRGVRARVHRSPSIALDVDSVDDLKRLMEAPRETSTHRLLEELGLSARLSVDHPGRV
ncbi:MAG: 2-phospho-L-lactate guanylyltransferase [Candidatus Bathyarchaeia archaeon]